MSPIGPDGIRIGVLEDPMGFVYESNMTFWPYYRTPAGPNGSRIGIRQEPMGVRKPSGSDG
eukprot:7491238-Pyramimonas_sp.AAC.1